MADISRITDLSGVTYDLKDSYAMSYPYQRSLGSRVYNGVIATSNDNVGGGFFYLKVRPTTYQSIWRVKTRVRATIPEGTNANLYNTDSTFEVWGQQNTYSGYISTNYILSTSYRPIYYHTLFLTNSTGYNNGCGHWIGFSLYNSTNPLSAALSRTITVDVLEYDNCEVELSDNLITPTNIPERAAHTSWYTSTNTSFTNLDACSNGIKQTGDANSTSISNLYVYSGHYQADSEIYRYQLLFQKDENKLTPLNNVSNSTGTSKAMLTEVEFDPFGRIFYYYSTTTVSTGGNVGAGALFYGFSGLDLRYTLNCGTTLTAHKPVYLIVTITNGKAKIANTTPWTQALPDLKDGKYYILLGRAYSTYQISLHPYHPIYYYDDGIKELIPGPEKANKDNPVFTGSISLGRKNGTIIGPNSYAVGTDVVASGFDSHAEGSYSSATGRASHAEGSSMTIYDPDTQEDVIVPVTASADGAHAEGIASKATGNASHAEGLTTTASNQGAHAEGSNTTASGSSAHSEGYGNTASGNGAHAEGRMSEASGVYSHSEGNGTIASGANSHSEGDNTVANHKSQHTFGEYNVEDTSTAAVTARGTYIEIVGKGTSSERSNARTLDWNGNERIAGDLYVGCNSDSTGGSKVAKTASPVFTGSISLGRSYGTTVGYNSFVNGTNNTASASDSHAEGQVTVASGWYSHSEGTYTIAAGTAQHASGKWNVEDQNNTYAEIVGNGWAEVDPETSQMTEHRSNARVLDWNGNERLMGDLYVGCNANSSGGKKVLTGDNPVFTGSISLGRVQESSKKTGTSSTAFGYNVRAMGSYSNVTGSSTIGMSDSGHVFGEYNVPEAEEWKANKQYHVGDIYVIYKEVAGQIVNVLYFKCNTDHTSSNNLANDSAYWNNISTHELKYAEIVGNGYAEMDDQTFNVVEHRSNARALDWSGNEYLKGDVYVGCNSDSTGGTKVATLNDILDPTSIIDDTATTGTTNKTWSANKLVAQLATKYTTPQNGIPATDMTSAVQTSLGKADSAYQKPSGGIPKTDLVSAVQTSLGKADTAYQKPSGGVPSSDMTSAVQTSLGKADSAYQKPSGGIPKTDLTSAVQTSLGKADSAYQKPSGGIPASDIASGVIPDVSGKINGPSSSVNNHVAIFDGTTGKTIKDSGYTIGKSVPSDAVFTDTKVTSSFSRPSYQPSISDVTIQPLINDLRANHLAFLPPSQIIIEKTIDGGQTWTSADVSDATKAGLFAETRPVIALPKINNRKDILCGLRVTFTAMKYNVPDGTAETEKYNYWNSSYVSVAERYNNLREMYFWLDTGPDKMNIKIQRATGANPNIWSTVFDDSSALFQGWSGNNYIQFSSGTFGGNATQTGNSWNYRVTFMTACNQNATELTESSITSAQSILEIRGYGTCWWTRGNQYASSDHMYSWDKDKNVTFPAKVTATNFAGTINGYTVAKSVPSDAVFTDTTYQSKAAASGGTDVSLVTTGEKYTWNNKYTKPSGGIPKSDLVSAVQTSLGKADTAYQKPSTGIPFADMASVVQTSIGKADSAYQKPYNGIPASDLASGVIPTLTDLIDDTVGNGVTNKVWSADKVYDQLALKAATSNPEFTDSIKINVLEGTGVLGRDAGSGASPRYFPSTWSYNTNIQLSSGVVITIKLPVNGITYGCYVSIDNGVTYKPVIYHKTTRLTTELQAENIITLVYDADGSATSIYPAAGGNSSTTVTGGCWRMLTNTNNTYSEISNANIAGTGSSTGLVSGRRVKYALEQNLKAVSGDVQLYGVHLTGQIPAVTADDNGKILRVVDGVWTAVSLPSASGVSF